jgi:hypothetical protein
MKAWVIFFFTSLAALSAQENTQQCSFVRQTYNQKIEDLNKNCAQYQECKLSYISWDPCRAPVAFNKDQESLEEAILDFRVQAHQVCLYIVKPCPAIPSYAFCMKNRCQTFEEIKEQEDIDLTFHFKNQNGDDSEDQITIEYDTGIRCVTTPCDSVRELKKIAIDEKGRSSIKLSLFMNFFSESPMQREIWFKTIQGVRHQILLHKILMNTDSVHEIIL